MPGTGDIMTRRPRQNHSPAFKAKVALAAPDAVAMACKAVRSNSSDRHCLQYEAKPKIIAAAG
ncbi:hypothetical protein DEM27_20865 [Metarhizobium album]|uniref:Transposase n=2 Tax=Metarhizobium album TaxID=2182425 RepID=A0A2U2DMS5_9HYPH|nr:hypothetical protein DEM27_20865 [Rhizobium album]